MTNSAKVVAFAFFGTLPFIALFIAIEFVYFGEVDRTEVPEVRNICALIYLFFYMAGLGYFVYKDLKNAGLSR